MNRILKTGIIFVCIILIISIAIYCIGIRKKKNNIEEYQPEEEISLEQERKTLVSLFFVNKTNKEIQAEARLIDVKELVKEPYLTLLNLLIEGPKNSSLEKVIPEGVRINDVRLQGDTLVIDFSYEFINVEGEEDEKNLISTIVKTLTELAEVNRVKILIDGEEDKAFLDNIITFKESFVRE